MKRKVHTAPDYYCPHAPNCRKRWVTQTERIYAIVTWLVVAGLILGAGYLLLSQRP